MFCGECGTQNPDTNSFCKNCGKPLKKAQAAAPAAAVPAPAPAPPAVQETQPSYYIPPAGAQQQAPTGAAAATGKPKRTWLGIVSLVAAIASWLLYPVLLGIAAVVLGVAGIVLAKQRNAKIPKSAVFGIVIGLLAIIANIYWLDIFPPEQVLPPVQ